MTKVFRIVVNKSNGRASVRTKRQGLFGGLGGLTQGLQGLNIFNLGRQGSGLGFGQQQYGGYYGNRGYGNSGAYGRQGYGSYGRGMYGRQGYYGRQAYGRQGYGRYGGQAYGRQGYGGQAYGRQRYDNPMVPWDRVVLAMDTVKTTVELERVLYNLSLVRGGRTLRELDCDKL
ncbi:hypothetical protein ANCCEY_13652 [Ancylostoma ceylanicum]|uniref:Uncharacterized protein n=1 Tax=Ancylostoma ceylanicum TaxID=53326 RepID=A0A0D6L8A0_9BILA|nr:hypothetical protein ANCCEY_13652 [Ancylostoma ceylanicum]